MTWKTSILSVIKPCGFFVIYVECYYPAINHKNDETEFRSFYCRHYSPFSFYAMPLFLKGREKEGQGE